MRDILDWVGWFICGLFAACLAIGTIALFVLRVLVELGVLR